MNIRVMRTMSFTSGYDGIVNRSDRKRCCKWTYSACPVATWLSSSHMRHGLATTLDHVLATSHLYCGTGLRHPHNILELYITKSFTHQRLCSCGEYARHQPLGKDSATCAHRDLPSKLR